MNWSIHASHTNSGEKATAGPIPLVRIRDRERHPSLLPDGLGETRGASGPLIATPRISRLGPRPPPIFDRGPRRQPAEMLGRSEAKRRSRVASLGCGREAALGVIRNVEPVKRGEVAARHGAGDETPLAQRVPAVPNG
jgi:hypothetical protein